MTSDTYIYIGWVKDIINRLIPGKDIFDYPSVLNPISGREGNLKLRHLLEETAPFLAGRIGSTELRNLLHFNGIIFAAKAPYYLEKESGIFPRNYSTAKRFIKETEESLSSIDILISFGWEYEGYLKQFLNHDAIITKPRALEPYLIPDEGWWHALGGKKLLIVNCFASLIKQRFTYEILEKLWPNEKQYLDKIIPKHITAIDTPLNWETSTKQRFKSYSDVTCDLKKKIDSADFDIALVACGGIGLPLAAWIKNQGKQAIHTGGVIQVFTGINGKRFSTQMPWKEIDKTHWVNAPQLMRTEPAFGDAASYWYHD